MSKLADENRLRAMRAQAYPDLLPDHPLSEQAEQEPDEPVAFIHESIIFPGVKYLEWKFNAPGYEGKWNRIPLYASPQNTHKSDNKPVVDALIEAFGIVMASESRDQALNEIEKLATSIRTGIQKEKNK